MNISHSNACAFFPSCTSVSPVVLIHGSLPELLQLLPPWLPLLSTAVSTHTICGSTPRPSPPDVSSLDVRTCLLSSQLFPRG